MDVGFTRAVAAPLDAAKDRLLAGAEQDASSRQKTKIEKAGQDFESILLTGWLQKAETSFASLPGSDDDEDGDAGADQYQGLAMQALGGALARDGGIGVARMIVAHLETQGTPGSKKEEGTDHSRNAAKK